MSRDGRGRTDPRRGHGLLRGHGPQGGGCQPENMDSPPCRALSHASRAPPTGGDRTGVVTSEGHGLKGQPGPGSNPGQGRLSEAPLPRDEGAPGPRDATAVPQVPPSAPPPLTCGLLVPKPSVGVVGTDMEWGPIGELMTEKGGPMPLMGECSCPGEPSGAPRPGPKEGCSEGAAMEPRPVGELRGEEFTWVEKSARQEAQEAVRTPQMGLLPRPEATKESQAQTSIPSIPRGSPTPIPSNTARPGRQRGARSLQGTAREPGAPAPPPCTQGSKGRSGTIADTAGVPGRQRPLWSRTNSLPRADKCLE